MNSSHPQGGMQIVINDLFIIEKSDIILKTGLSRKSSMNLMEQS